jgi:hypothetical protein
MRVYLRGVVQPARRLVGGSFGVLAKGRVVSQSAEGGPSDIGRQSVSAQGSYQTYASAAGEVSSAGGGPIPILRFTGYRAESSSSKMREAASRGLSCDVIARPTTM